VNGVTPGNTVYIYKDPICTDAYVVTTQLASAAAVEIILPTLTENNYTFYARAKDTSGNYSNCTAVGLDYSLDLTPPNLPTGMSRITPAAALGNVNTPTIQVAGVSNGTVVKIYLDDNTCSNTAFATQTATSTSVNITLTTISDGSHNFYAKTFDAVGNSSACSAASSISLNYTVDTTPPTAPSSFVDGSTVTSITYTPDATWNASSDANGIARYELAVGSSPSGTDIKTWTSVSIPNPLSASLSGFTVTNGVTYYTRIRAVDNAGNYSTIVNGDGWVGSIPVVGSVVESCALKTDGAVYCWGPNNYGQVGDGSTVDRLTPYGIPTLSSGVTSITSSPDGTSYCAIKSGAVYCWGRNDNGQLGNNTTTNQKTPVQPLDGGTLQPTILASGVTQIAMSNYHTCALKNTILYCWGTNSWGQLGTGNTNNYYTPALIISSGVSSVSLSYGWNGTSTYAIMSTGELRTWGYNGYYQLGNSNTTSSNTPIPNIFTSGVTAAVSNDYQTCVIRNGALLCWGYQANTTYYLANNFYNYSNVSPTPSTGISSGVTAVALGNQFGCAIVNAQLQCWGNNGYGQVGNGNTSNPSSIYVNPNLTSISALYIKDNRTCVVKSSGALYCFGANGSGESGSNTGFDNYVTSNPVAAVSSGTGTSTKSVAMSVNGSTCAVVSSGLRCWGRMDRGQVPIGVIGNKTTPSTITLGGGTTGVTKVTKGTGNLYSSMPTRCAIRSGNLFCWGANHAGQIGDGTTTYKSTPYQVLTGGVTDVKVSTSGTVCAIQSGAVKCWGYNGYGNVGDSGSTNRTTPYAVPSMNLGVTALDIAPDHTCGVSNSIAVCWGYNGYGQVTGTNVNNGNNLPPTTISSVQYVTNVYTMNNRTCLMSTTAGSSTLYCWGYNPYGALGTYNTTNYYTPQVIWGSGGFTFYAYSQEEAAHSCGIKSGSLACWGYNGYGQLGIGNTSQYTYPVGVSATNPTFIAIGTQWSSNSTCGIFNGAMKCWGYNGQGQLATGDTTQQTTPFATVLNGAVDAVNKISLSNVGGCAVVGDTGSGGYLRCWGQNNYGQVGNGTLNNLYTPNANIINSGVTHVETSHNGEITCAIVNTTLQCWGRNDQGQIGDGTGPVMTPATISL
jgi:alpha-tubulin suppressor-like RCC1 family protein